jgi:hypothetical protein
MVIDENTKLVFSMFIFKNNNQHMGWSLPTILFLITQKNAFLKFWKRQKKIMHSTKQNKRTTYNFLENIKNIDMEKT